MKVIYLGEILLALGCIAKIALGIASHEDYWYLAGLTFVTIVEVVWRRLR